jgi:3-keto-5-aminohexanoate cleavage enzyme
LARKIIVTVASVGSIPTRDDSPYIPITPDEVGEEVRRSVEAGAAVAHLHARDQSTGAPTSDVSIYRAYIEGVKSRCNAITQITTGGGAVTLNLSPEERIRAVLDLRPEMASLNAGSMNFGRKVFSNPPDVIELFAREMTAAGVKPEFEVYDPGMIANVKRLILGPGLLSGTPRFGIVLGIQGGIPATVPDLQHMVASLPAGASWQAIAIGRDQIPIGAVAAVMGGDLRVGLEDNLYVSKGVLARSNAELVEKAVRVIRDLGFEPATPAEARRQLGLTGE